LSHLNWKTGFEIELIAPVAKSRRDLANAIAANHGGTVKTIFYPQSEPSKAAGIKVFENLVLGFEVLDASGARIALCVDDLTIISGLDFHTKSKQGWYRIISDDARLLELVMAHCDPDEHQRNVLQSLAKLFGGEIQKNDGDLYKVTDRLKRSVAIAASLPGERERVCEIITAPIEEQHEKILSGLLTCATDLGFSVPKEAAVHVHYDAKKLNNARVFCRMVDVFAMHGDKFKKLVKTNPHCRRLGALSPKLVQQCGEPGFAKIGWKPARKKLETLDVSKYTDFNFLNLINETPGKDTFEIRIFPGSMNAEAIKGYAAMFARVLTWCCEVDPDVPTPVDFVKLLELVGVQSA
jgi:hypothetical protein